MLQLPYLVAALSSIIFGFSFLFTKGALDYLNPHQLLAFRFLLAALALTALRGLGLVKFSLRGRSLPGALILSAIQPIVYFLCETTGVQLTTSSEAGMMIALIPVVVAISGAVFLKEKPSPTQWAFILLSVFGVLFVARGGGAVSVSGHGLGLLALAGAVISAAMYSIMSRRLSTSFRPVELTYLMMWTGAIFFGLLTVVEHAKDGRLGEILLPLAQAQSISAVLYLGLLSSVVAFFSQNYALSKIEASRSAVFANLTTIISTVAGVVFRGEPFLWYHWIGGALILTGVWGTNYYARSKKSALIEQPDTAQA